jgi:hypothetical protein
MAIYHLPTGTYETRAALAVRGGPFRDKRHFAASAVLVRHPRGDLLIDADRLGPGAGAGLADRRGQVVRVRSINSPCASSPHQS